MKPEQQRIAIAEACGWTEIEPCTCCDGVSRGYEPTLGAHKKHLPDYLNDLNAMHEAEQTLWEKDWTSRHDFVDKLARIISPTHGYYQQSGIDLLDATAAERAEAFLRTINKWEEIIHGHVARYSSRETKPCIGGVIKKFMEVEE